MPTLPSGTGPRSYTLLQIPRSPWNLLTITRPVITTAPSWQNSSGCWHHPCRWGVGTQTCNKYKNQVARHKHPEPTPPRFISGSAARYHSIPSWAKGGRVSTGGACFGSSRSNHAVVTPDPYTLALMVCCTVKQIRVHVKPSTLMPGWCQEAFHVPLPREQNAAAGCRYRAGAVSAGKNRTGVVPHRPLLGL